MPIRVTCPSCHTRFNVSDKFAGKEGPCPKCKKTIRVPDASEEVKVHEREVGPKDSKGRAILKPIARQETKVSSVQLTIIIAGIVMFFVLSLVMRLMIVPEDFPQWLLMLSAVVIAPATAFAAYTFLRNQELGTIPRDELIKRIAACSIIYALLWFAMPLAKYAFNDRYEMGSWMVALVAMLALGGATGMFSMDFDYLFGLIHYGLYLVICLLGRVIAGIGILPGIHSQPSEPVQQVAPSIVHAGDFLEPLQSLIAIVFCFG
jgi:predicted Zn finger-like uncharacterized protein